MKERPILMNGEMVRATLDDRKTKTRRIIKTGDIPHDEFWAEQWLRKGKCPYGQPGDRLWVRETWRYRGSHWCSEWPENRVTIEYCADEHRAIFKRAKADKHGIPQQNMPERLCGVNRDPTTTEGFDLLMEYNNWLSQWWDRKQPSIFLPRWACRLVLEVKSVRVERLQDISEEDAIAEGVKWKYGDFLNAAHQFQVVWDSINEKRGFGWGANPWVWVIEFEPLVGYTVDQEAITT